MNGSHPFARLYVCAFASLIKQTQEPYAASAVLLAAAVLASVSPSVKVVVVP